MSGEASATDRGMSWLVTAITRGGMSGEASATGHGVSGAVLGSIVVTLLLSALACTPPGEVPSTSSATSTAPASTPTTVVMIITVAPVATSGSPSALPPAAPPPLLSGPEQPLRLTSDGVVAPPSFRLAGGSYVFAWDVPRPAAPGGCFFSAMLTSEPSVSPFTLQTLGPWTVAPTNGYSGSTRIEGLGAGGYSLRSTGDCPWTVTITPFQRR